MYVEATHCKECGKSRARHCPCGSCYFFECVCEDLTVNVRLTLPVFDPTSMYQFFDGLTGQITLDRETFFKSLDIDSKEWLKDAHRRRNKQKNARKAKERREAKKLLKELNI